MTAPEIKRHPDGTRYVQPYLGTNAATGRPLRPYHRFRAELTDEECRREAEEWLASIAPATGMRVGMRLGDLLARYIADLEAQGSPANTVRTYRTLSRYAGRLAARDVRTIRVWEVDDLYSRLMTSGGRGGSGLSGRTVLALHWFLRGAFAWMASIGAVGSSPIASATHPRGRRAEAVALDAASFAAVDAALRSELASDPASPRAAARQAAAFAAYLALAAGLRCGEACAVRRCDVWADRALLHVGGTVVEPGGAPVRQPATKGGRARNVALAASDMDVIAVRMRRLSALPSWSPETPLVTVLGDLSRPSAVSTAVSGIFRDAGVPPGATFHSLRHTHATWLLAHGADIKTVSERLGHADVATTLQIYAHVMPGRDRAAAELFAQARDSAG